MELCHISSYVHGFFFLNMFLRIIHVALLISMVCYCLLLIAVTLMAIPQLTICLLVNI